MLDYIYIVINLYGFKKEILVISIGTQFANIGVLTIN